MTISSFVFSHRAFLRHIKIVYIFALLCGLGDIGFAQNLSIQKPEDRVVTPGDFVTLVFRLTTTKEIEVEVSANSNWSVLRQPGTQKLSPGRSKPVAVTLAVPLTAEARSIETVEVHVTHPEQMLQESVNLSVAEFRNLKLQTPNEFIVNQNSLDLTIINDGNVQEDVVLNVMVSTTQLLNKPLTLIPFSSEVISLEPQEAGLYILTIEQNNEAVLTEVIDVIRFGPPENTELVLAGVASARVDSRANWQVQTVIEGPLSDFASFDTQLNTNNWQQSFAELETDDFSTRVGKTNARPFGLRLTSNFGLSGSWTPSYNNGTSLAASLSWLEQNKYAMYIAGQYQDDRSILAAGSGIYGGNINSDLKVFLELDKLNLQARTSLIDDRLNIETKIDILSELRRTSLELTADALLTEYTSLQGSFNHTQNGVGNFDVHRPPI